MFTTSKRTIGYIFILTITSLVRIIEFKIRLKFKVSSYITTHSSSLFRYKIFQKYFFPFSLIFGDVLIIYYLKIGIPFA